MDLKTFCLLTPSRGRPERLRQMMDSALATAARRELVRIEVLVDADDAALPQYETLHRQYPAMSLVVNPKRTLVPAAFQQLAERAGGDLLMMGSDDVLFRTPGWDNAVRAAFARHPDDLALVYPSDGHGNGRAGDIKGNHWWVSLRWVEVVGFFCPVEFEHFCCDTVPEKIAAQAGRFIHLPEVLVEHLHFKYGQAVKDETYAFTRTPDGGTPMHKRDEAKMAAMAGRIAEIAARVRSEIEKAQAVA